MGDIKGVEYKTRFKAFQINIFFLLTFHFLGPDAQNLKQVQCSCDQEELTLQFFSTVLHLRGPEVVPQPRFNPTTGDVLCWNGEIFGGIQVKALI